MKNFYEFLEQRDQHFYMEMGESGDRRGFLRQLGIGAAGAGARAAQERLPRHTAGQPAAAGAAVFPPPGLAEARRPDRRWV